MFHWILLIIQCTYYRLFKWAPNSVLDAERRSEMEKEMEKLYMKSDRKHTQFGSFSFDTLSRIFLLLLAAAAVRGQHVVCLNRWYLLDEHLMVDCTNSMNEFQPAAAATANADLFGHSLLFTSPFAGCFENTQCRARSMVHTSDAKKTTRKIENENRFAVILRMRLLNDIMGATVVPHKRTHAHTSLRAINWIAVDRFSSSHRSRWTTTSESCGNSASTITYSQPHPRRRCTLYIIRRFQRQFTTQNTSTAIGISSVPHMMRSEMNWETVNCFFWFAVSGVWILAMWTIPSTLCSCRMNFYFCNNYRKSNVKFHTK